MQVKYLVEITDPKTHMVRVRMKFSPLKDVFSLFLPSWSPGSYLMREYARHIRGLKGFSASGERLFIEQKEKGRFEVNLILSSLESKTEEVEIDYEVYCHELTVRTSHIDNTHAFLHGPTYLMGILDVSMEKPELTLRFPALWSKVSTGLKDISPTREVFVYTAKNYDELIDTPIEIGCHETDGFVAFGKEHELAFYGSTYPHQNNLKADMKKIVEHVADTMGGNLPYDKYTFITHFVPKIYGGLEHLNSTALHFDGRKLGNRKDYINWLSLVAHEYFHTWNVKRIRPKELGPFNYLSEGYTKLLWLAEGLTSFMDDLFVLRARLCTLEEYLDVVRGNFETYYATPGRKFHSLEESSFNAWIKLYRPDENSKNSSISYYLKGGLVFSCLNVMLFENQKNINDFLQALWLRFQENPEQGMTQDEVFKLIEKLVSLPNAEKFSDMVLTTEEIDFEHFYKKMGLTFKWDEPKNPSLGIDLEYRGDRAIIKAVTLDGAAFKAGLNAMDEIIAINGLRVLKEDMDQLTKMLKANMSYRFLVSRLDNLQEIDVVVGESPRVLKEIMVHDRELALRCLGVSV